MAQAGTRDASSKVSCVVSEAPESLRGLCCCEHFVVAIPHAPSLRTQRHCYASPASCPIQHAGDHTGHESLAAEFKLRSKEYRVQPPPSLTVKLGGAVQICDRGDSGCLLSRREAYPEAPHVLVVEVSILKARAFDAGWPPAQAAARSV